MTTDTKVSTRGVKYWLQRIFGGFRPAFLPVLATYFCYGASAITSVALLFFEKEALKLTPAEAAAIAFWVALPWSTKMVVGVASDVYPILGSRRKSYLMLGGLLSLAGYVFLATVAQTRGVYLAAMVLVTVGFVVQDVVADALSVEVAQTDEEVAQIQTLGRMALLLGGISVGYLSGVLAAAIGSRGVFAVATLLPALVMISALFVRPGSSRAVLRPEVGPLKPDKAHLVMGVGVGYALLGALRRLCSPSWPR
jgi:Dipeptide/tripeptide permease